MTMPDTNLDQIQRWMQTAITHSGGVSAETVSVEQIIRRSRQQTASERLQVYTHAYIARLLDCLREEYPAVRQASGDDAFDAFAVGYLQEYPSASYTLANLGVKFPDFLAQTRTLLVVPPTGGPHQPDRPQARRRTDDFADFLIDLARLERLYSELFDGPGVEGQSLLNASHLSAVPPGQWPDARLVPVCCLKLIKLDFRAHEYISALRRNENPVPPERTETFLAVTRRDFVIRRHALSHVQFELLRALIEGRTVSEAISAADAIMPHSFEAFAHSLHDWFSAWTAAGFFQTVVCPA